MNLAPLTAAPAKLMILQNLKHSFAWTFILGFPLILLHMMLFNFEHDQQMEISISIIKSMFEMIPRHPISLLLWHGVIFIASFSVRRNFQQKILLTQAQNTIKAVYTKAMTDSLTGVWNCRGFDNLLLEIETESRQLRCPYSIILGDVDNFKEINDSLGHPAADRVLIQISKIVSR